MSVKPNIESQLKRARTAFRALDLLVKHHSLIQSQAGANEIPTLELASDIHEMATQLLDAVSALKCPSATLPIEASFVIARCGTCGWFNYFSSPGESPETCPTCSSNLVIRNQTDMSEIIYPTVTVN